MVMVMGSRLRRGCIIGALALLSTAAAGVIFKQWTSRGGDDTGVVLNVGEVGLEKEKDVHVNEVEEATSLAHATTERVTGEVKLTHLAMDKGDNGDGGPRRPPQKKPLRVAVCFFGLTRSLRWTLPSIEARLLGVLRDSGMEVDVFVHTYKLVEVNNIWSGEKGINYREYENDFRVLNATRASVTDQDEFDRVWPDPLSLTRYDWSYTKGDVDSVIRNVFRAYWSMAAVWSLLVQHAMETNARYDAVVVARPDVWFHVDTDLPKRTFPLPARTVHLPSFDGSAKAMRKNDRFAYGSMTAMGVLMNRIATLTDPNADQCRGGVDTEWVLGHHLKLSNISVKMLEFPFARVRLTGDIPTFDQKLVQKACESGKDRVACEMVQRGFKFPTGSPDP